MPPVQGLPTKVITFRVDNATHDLLRLLTSVRGVSLSDVLNQILSAARVDLQGEVLEQRLRAEKTRASFDALLRMGEEDITVSVTDTVDRTAVANLLAVGRQFPAASRTEVVVRASAGVTFSVLSPAAVVELVLRRLALEDEFAELLKPRTSGRKKCGESPGKATGT